MVEAKEGGALVYDQGLDPRAWIRAIGTTYLNHDLKVMSLKDIQIPKGVRKIFIKPMFAHKAVEGAIYDSLSLKRFQETAVQRKNDRGLVPTSFPYPGTKMLVARAKSIPNNQARFWWIGGTVVLDDHEHLILPEEFPQTKDREEIKRIFKRLHRALGQPIMTADFIKYGGRIRMTEMNGPNFAGGSLPHVNKVLGAWLAQHGTTVRENLVAYKKAA